MMKCLVPLLYIATTVGSVAQQCPVFTGPEDYTCDTYDRNQRLTNAEKFPLQIKRGTVDGLPSYQVRSNQGTQALVIGRPLERTLDGKTYVATASCGQIKGSRGTHDAVVLRNAIKDGPVVSETYFYPEGGGAVRMTFGGNGPDGGLTAKNVCRPVYPSRKAP